MKKNVFVAPRHSAEEERKFDADVGDQVALVKEFIITVSERAFKKYAKAHGANESQQEQEWNRYKRILSKML